MKFFLPVLLCALLLVSFTVDHEGKYARMAEKCYDSIAYYDDGSLQYAEFRSQTFGDHQLWYAPNGRVLRKNVKSNATYRCTRYGPDGRMIYDSATFGYLRRIMFCDSSGYCRLFRQRYEHKR